MYLVVRQKLKSIPTSIVLTAVLAAAAALRVTGAESPHAEIAWFLEAASTDERLARPAMDKLAAVWRHGYTALVVDLARFMQPAARPRSSGAVDANELLGEGEDERDGFDVNAPSMRGPSAVVRARLTRFLERQTGQRFGDDLGRWREWMWSLPYDPHPEYAAFKGRLYERVDPRMRGFFPPAVPAAIRLDEIDWGGVGVNGIPPLVMPKHVAADAARDLRDSNVVFGLVVNGEARAYPKRILAWHELARDRIGGVDVTIVYCTLCGTVIPYESRTGGRTFTFGTSGLLYRSNKLMFDEETSSLWSTFEGRPVVGPLVNQRLQLRSLPIVTTTWREWRTEHPRTTVLSLETGYERDYSEGAAYRDYFATDRLWFSVPHTDRRLRNKAEVLVMLVPPVEDGARQPLAIAVDFLKRTPLFQTDVRGRRLVVVTSAEGANRVYEAGGERFVRRLDAVHIEDADGAAWEVTEEALVSEAGDRLPRLAAQRAFWFGWYAQFPDTQLIK